MIVNFLVPESSLFLLQISIQLLLTLLSCQLANKVLTLSGWFSLCFSWAGGESGIIICGLCLSDFTSVINLFFVLEFERPSLDWSGGALEESELTVFKLNEV